MECGLQSALDMTFAKRSRFELAWNFQPCFWDRLLTKSADEKDYDENREL